MADTSQNTFDNLSLPAAAARITAARAAKQAAVAQMLGLAQVRAVGIGFRNVDRQGRRELCIICSVERKLPLNELADNQRVPPYVGGFRTDVVATGRFRALTVPRHTAPSQKGKRNAEGDALQTARLRPAAPGGSIGHVDVTAGTFGCVVARNGEYLLLSNNHVIANGNAARLGNSIVQPGIYDGGNARKDMIASLVEFIPIIFDGESDTRGAPGAPASPAQPRGCGGPAGAFASKRARPLSINRAGANRVDCAIAKPSDPTAITTRILGIGSPVGAGIGALGMQVQKSGRTTGLTRGEIEQIDVTSKIDYDNKTATFTGQLMASAASAGGDSGSVVLDMTGHVVGLLFAGSNAATLINPIQDVLDALQVTVVAG